MNIYDDLVPQIYPCVRLNLKATDQFLKAQAHKVMTF